MGSPVGYLLVVGAAPVIALALVAIVRRRRATSRARSAIDSVDEGFPGLSEFAAAHGWQGPRDDVSLDLDEVRSVVSIAMGEADQASSAHLFHACTGHYRGMGILIGNILVTAPPDHETDVGVVVVNLPYLLPRKHAVHAAPAVAEAIARRDDWTLEFSSGRLICVRRAPFGTVADLARTLDGLADVVSAIPADLVARFTVVMPRLPDGRISDPHDAASVGDALEQMTPAQRAAFIDQMRGLRRSRPKQ